MDPARPLVHPRRQISIFKIIAADLHSVRGTHWRHPISFIKTTHFVVGEAVVEDKDRINSPLLDEIVADGCGEVPDLGSPLELHSCMVLTLNRELLCRTAKVSRACFASLLHPYNKPMQL